MPSGYTTETGSTQSIRGFAEWWTDGLDDSGLSVYVYGAVYMRWAYLYGCAIDVAIDYPEGTGRSNATGSGVLTSNPGSAYAWVAGTDAAGYRFERGATAYSAFIRARAYGKNVSGYGAFNGDTGWQTLGTVTIPAIVVNAPTGLTATNVNNQIKLAWADRSANESGFSVERSANGTSGWAQVLTTAANATTATDTSAPVGTSYYRVRAVRGSIVSGYSNTASAIRYSAPAAVSNVTNTRNSDNSNTVGWKNNPTTNAPYSTLRLSRSVDGGGASQLADISGAAVSYQDNSTASNHSYRYFVQPINPAGAGSAVGSNTTLNTPATPTGLAASRVDATTVRVDFTNPALTEAGIKVQRSANGSTWSDVKSVAGDSLTSVTDAPGGGTWYYRLAAYTSTGLQSGWSAASNAVVTIVAPAAPTLTAPATGSVASLAAGTVRLMWKHNAIDGSAQTAAQVRVSTDGGATWASPVAVSGATAYYDLALAQYAALGGSPVYWQARTKGAHADYSPWSASSTFRAYQVPQISITAPATDSTVITDVPLEVSWSYSDQTGSTQVGTQQSAVVEIHKDGAEAYRKSITGSDTTLLIPAAWFLPQNSSAYTITLTVTSTTTLSSTTQRGFAVDYLEPALPSADISVDDTTALAQVTAHIGTDGTAADTRTLGVFRKHPDGRMIPLGDGLGDSATVTDIYPPLDMPYTYVIVAYTANGFSSQSEYDVTVPSHGAVFFNYGTDRTEVTKIARDIQQPQQLGQDHELVETAGLYDEFPRVFFDAAVKAHKGTVSGSVGRNDAVWPAPDDPSRLENVYSLAGWRGIVVLRRPGEYAIPVVLGAIDLDENREPRKIPVSAPWTRVRADGLAL